MQDVIKWLSFLIAVIGIAGLWFVSASAEPVDMKLGMITEDDIGKYVRVEGIIERLTETEKGFFITLRDGGAEMKVVMWKDDRTPDVKENDSAEVTGKVSLYQGVLEIIADSASVLR